MKKCGVSAKPGHGTLRLSTSLIKIKTFSQGYTILCHPRWVLEVVYFDCVCSCVICIIQTHLSTSDRNKILNGLNLGKPEEELTDLLRWIKSIRVFHSWKVCIHVHIVHILHCYNVTSLLYATLWNFIALMFIICVTSCVYHLNINLFSAVFPVEEAKVQLEN